MPKYVCARCGCSAKPIIYRRGSIGVEIILWLCLIIPGLAYTVWRFVTRARICPNCYTDTMISTKSSLGQKLIGA